MTRNPKKRWGKREVSLWLSGKRNIPVYYEEEHTGRMGISKPYEFHDENYYSLHDLMYAFMGDPVSSEMHAAYRLGIPAQYARGNPDGTVVLSLPLRPVRTVLR
mgnify:CR=1 FL=1